MNSSFFIRSVRILKHHNSISTILDKNDRCFNDSFQIKNVLVDHFSNLWNNTEIRPIEWYLDALPSDLPTLTNDQQTYLSRPISKDEIYMTLLSLLEGKSPGPNGFNVEFYNFFWNDIEGHLVPAISYFFDKVVVPIAWGRISNS